jgi:sensor c-di-GMP phosphodiesterase-like protein
MTRGVKSRVSVFITWMLIAGCCGALLGYFVGRSQVEEQAKQQAVDAATRAQTLIASMITESRALLSAWNEAHLPACSPAEIDLLRRNVYEGRNIRDGGRIDDGQLRCSALFEESEFPRTPIKPTIRAADGLSFYRNVLPYSSGDHNTYVLQQGSFYIVLDPAVLRKLREFSDDVEATTIDATTGKRVRPSGLALVGGATVLDRNWQGGSGDTLYATRCTDGISMCSTAYESRTAFLHAGCWRIGLTMAMGCILGMFPVLCGCVLMELRQGTASQLMRAIRKDRIMVLYQPIVELKTRRVVGAEALARWTDEGGNPVSPEAFVRIGEQRGFIGELTQLVLRRAVADFRAILLGDREFRLNVNVTATDLEDANFIVHLEDLLRATRVNAESIAFEVTEGTTASKPLALDTLRELRRLGHRIEIDDFGTGYSSLAYLNSFPVDAIKIDQSFTRTVETSGPAGDILPQILSIARTLNLMVIVEGIETPGQAEYFAGYEGTLYGQGWLFGRPVSAEEFHRSWLGAECHEKEMGADAIDLSAN